MREKGLKGLTLFLSLCAPESGYYWQQFNLVDCCFGRF